MAQSRRRRRHIVGNELFPAKEDTNSKELLLDLLNTNFDFQRPSNVGIELANKLEELNQLENLKEQFTEAKDAEISYAIDGLSSSHPNKRGKNLTAEVRNLHNENSKTLLKENEEDTNGKKSVFMDWNNKYC
ncbi:urotensin-2B isoform X2 [Canis lupus baileyi]|uniref:urotensin-2B isoform X2 n=1 Tax=Canis lupus familiaris TaxID=9615 RepID=UPI0018F28289|nr:urotensin-2B isoform X2 [Canis lupus familiaris]XP_038318612.1 urotensin-2B isoform X2 [Canis lupus familiaris]XP_038439630.1 urotensin-2B isoform X2 [Canis lupus familiaris]